MLIAKISRSKLFNKVSVWISIPQALIGLAAIFLAIAFVTFDRVVIRESCGVPLAEREFESSAALKICSFFGYAEAQAWLGMMHWGGVDPHYDPLRMPASVAGSSAGTRDKLKNGWRLLSSAAAKGNPNAQNEIGNAYLQGEYGLSKDYAAARSFLEKSEAGGDEIAGYSLARIYAGGYGVEKDADRALMYLRASARRNYHPSICTLHRRYEIRYLTETDGVRIYAREPTFELTSGAACSQNQVMAELVELLPN